MASSEVEPEDRRPTLLLTYLVEQQSTTTRKDVTTMQATTTITDPNFTSPSDRVTSTEPIDGTSTTTLTTIADTMPTRAMTTRTAGSGDVFIRATYSVTTDADRTTVQQDLTSVIAAALTRAGIAIDVLVVVERLKQPQRSNTWRASVFVKVPEARAQATKNALQKLDVITLQTQLDV